MLHSIDLITFICKQKVHTQIINVYTTCMQSHCYCLLTLVNMWYIQSGNLLAVLLELLDHEYTQFIGAAL